MMIFLLSIAFAKSKNSMSIRNLIVKTDLKILTTADPKLWRSYLTHREKTVDFSWFFVHSVRLQSPTSTVLIEKCLSGFWIEPPRPAGLVLEHSSSLGVYWSSEEETFLRRETTDLSSAT
ncbi:hypothetical protein AUF62_02795 [archaeon 13_1_20CM_52_20]|nr:MAG: hypothetical protein AUF62_02795 [archaeon 13_1_20CM_52_20]